MKKETTESNSMRIESFTTADQFHYGAMTLGASSVLLVARFLRPSPAGLGTHQQLGLPACPFFHLTGLPCPTCGFTTSFAFGARLELFNSFFSNPAGFVLFILTALSIPISLGLMLFRVERTRLFSLTWPKTIGYGWLLLLLLSWAYKMISMLLITLRTADGSLK